MELDLFDYLFKGRNLAHKNQPIEILTDYTQIISGRFQGFYEDSSNKKVSIVEVGIGPSERLLIRYYEIISIRLTYVNEFFQDKCAYSLMAAFQYFEMYQKIEINLKTGDKVSGYLTSYPDSLGNFDPMLGITTAENDSFLGNLDEILSLTLVFEPHPYFEILKKSNS